jgi:hypothetical protein
MLPLEWRDTHKQGRNFIQVIEGSVPAGESLVKREGAREIRSSDIRGDG